MLSQKESKKKSNLSNPLDLDPVFFDEPVKTEISD